MSAIPPDRPMIEMRPQTVCCPAHGEHLRAQFPKGFVFVAMSLFQAAVAGDALANEIDPSKGKKHLDEARLNRILMRKPLCYWVTREEIRKAFMESEIGVLGRCQRCGLSGIGGPYSVSLPMGVQEMWLCFGCALDNGEALHRAHPRGGVWGGS